MDGWGWLDPRSDDLWARNELNRTGMRGGGFSRFQSNSTASQMNQFRFQAARSIRMSTIILATFNVIAAFATVVGILWDCYTTEKRNNPKFRFRYGLQRQARREDACYENAHWKGAELTFPQKIGLYFRRPGRDISIDSICGHSYAGNRFRCCAIDWTRWPTDPRMHINFADDVAR
jgi:hypothetical protein